MTFPSIYIVIIIIRIILRPFIIIILQNTDAMVIRDPEMTGCRSLEGLSIPDCRPSYCYNHPLSLARIFPRKLQGEMSNRVRSCGAARRGFDVRMRSMARAVTLISVLLLRTLTRRS
jgi:hypothetical protein